jgi:hypothetical protein
MASYRVENKTGQRIWWRDGAWTSGEKASGDVSTIDADHDADVTMYGKDSGGDHEWGRVWLLLGATLEVYGDKNWRLRRS